MGYETTLILILIFQINILQVVHLSSSGSSFSDHETYDNDSTWSVRVSGYSSNYTHNPVDQDQRFIMESIELRRLCFCENSEPVCDVQALPVTLTPGQSITLSLTSLNQYNDSVSTILYVRFTAEGNKHQQVLNREAHIIHPGCRNITFKVSSANPRELLTLSSYPISSSMNSLTLDMKFLPCPNGFELLPSSPKCQCSEYFQWIDSAKCRNEEYVVERKDNSWLEYSCTGTKQVLCGLRYHDNCPYHYCNQSVQSIDLIVPNSVCTGNRGGTLCGGCAENFSAVIGGSDCWDCRGISSTRTKILILTFAVTGILLVTITIVLDLRISSGRLNGLIFYAAVINLNQTTFLHTTNSVLSLFFSWLNLDLGFSVCSYNGMTPISKLWLQLAFPAYIMFLILILAIAFQFSLTLSNLSAVTLPSSITLFLLAYLKVLRITVSTLPFTRIHTYPYSSETMVWLYDGNVGYFDSEHIKLFIISTLFLVFVAFPYTFILISSHFLFQLDLLDSKSGLSLSIILDAYSGRTKAISKFWFGLLLLSYTFQIVIYHFTGGDTVTNLVVAILCASALLSLNLILDGPYSDKFTNKLEQFFFLNIIAVSAFHILFQGRESILSVCSDLLMSAALINFLGIILERCVKYTRFQFLKQFWEFVSGNRQSMVTSESSTVPVALTDSEPDWERDISLSSNTSIDNVINIREESIFDSPPEKEETQSTQEEEMVQVLPRMKTVTSSVLQIGKDGEASLVSDRFVVEQNARKDEHGVNTFVFKYVENTKENLQVASCSKQTEKPSTLTLKDNTITAPQKSNTSLQSIQGKTCLVLRSPRKPMHRSLRRSYTSHALLSRRYYLTQRKKSRTPISRRKLLLYN